MTFKLGYLRSASFVGLFAEALHRNKCLAVENQHFSFDNLTANRDSTKYALRIQQTFTGWSNDFEITCT